MSEELSLVTQLAIILIAAGIFTVISKALKQPLILGYIIAGFIVGPGLGIFPQFSEASVHEWSELGIIFLLFSLGLEFSFKKLIQVGSAALITAGTKCIGMFVVGIAAGAALHWSTMESIFLGGLLSMSSTTIIIKAYDEMGLKKKPYASLIFGSLVVEDLIAVLLLVLLSTMAVSNKFAGTEMLMAIVKLVFYIVLWFVLGIFLIPTLLKKARKHMTDEILLLSGIGLCFLMVVLANLAGFSSALGAFVMGSLLSSTLEGERIEKLTTSIKDLFGAIFFVSVGMLVDPAIIAQYWPVIIVITLVAMCGILIFSTTGVLLSGKGLDAGVHAGFSLAQLGEFAFIIAGEGVALGVMRSFIYPVIIAVSVVTTFTTPYMIKAADPVSVWLRKHLPIKLLSRIDPPQEQAVASSQAAKSEWTKLIRLYISRVGVYSVVLVGVVLASRSLLPGLSDEFLSNLPDWLTGLLETLVTLAVMSPMLLGLAVNGEDLKSCAVNLLRKEDSYKWPIFALILLRIFLATGFVLSVVMSHFVLKGWTVLLVFIGLAVLILLARGSAHRFTMLEDRFMQNLNEKEEEERLRAPVTSTLRKKMAGYDVMIQSLVVSPDFDMAGKELREMPFRHSSGVNIVKIVRGTHQFPIPSGDFVVMPGDKLLAVGTKEQLAAFSEAMKQHIVKGDDSTEDFVVDCVTLNADTPLTGQTLRSANMRASGCMVISVIRGDRDTTNPKPDFKFEEGDKVWIAGLASAVEWYK